MAILTDPLFSEEARGQVAKVAVFKRAKVHPVFSAFFYHQVKWSPSKIAQAESWKALCNAWRSLSASAQERWRSEAPGVLTGFNYFMQLKGEFPFEPCYEVPAGDALAFAFVEGEYSAPAGNEIYFNWEECV